MTRSPYRQSLADLIGGRGAAIAVAGLGYVGLPLAIAVAQAGFRTIGIDLDVSKVEGLTAGRSPIADVPAEQLKAVVGQGKLVFSTDYAAAAEARVAVIAVPTPIDSHQVPDLGHVRAAAEGLARVMQAPALIILESTVYPGATEEVVACAFRERAFAIGRDTFIAYSPERIDPGNEAWTLSNTPKIVAGLTADCRDLAIAFYGAFVDRLVPVSSLHTAETAKLFENTFRMVNIALVNEFQVVCDGLDIDVWEALAACKTKPYGFMAFQPGPGLGGHCIPVDPFYLAWKARGKHLTTEFIDLAGRINDGMPAYVVGRAAKLLNAQQRSLKGSRIAVLGAAYKRNSADTRESPALRIMELLLESGAIVSYHDPHVAELQCQGLPMTSRPLTTEYLEASDCVVVVTDHDAIDWTVVRQYAARVVDTRNVLERLEQREVVGVKPDDWERTSLQPRLESRELETA